MPQRDGTSRRDSSQYVGTRSGRKVFVGDFERRRPTKRMTTVRSFAVARNWVNEENDGKQDRQILVDLQQEQKNFPQVESSRTPLRAQIAIPKDESREVSHEPLSVEDVDMSMKDAPNPSPSLSIRNTSKNCNVRNALPMFPVESPDKDQLPHCSRSINGLPGGDVHVQMATVMDHTDITSSPINFEEIGDNFDIGDNIDIGDIPIVEKTDESSSDIDEFAMDDIEAKPPQSQLRSKPSQSGMIPSSQIGKDKVPLKGKQGSKKNVNGKKVNFDVDECEGPQFVRLFNADRGRRGGAAEITDMDVVLTNVEEIALEIKHEAQSPSQKSVIREAFVQLREILSDAIDVYKEKKYLQSTTAKKNKRLKKMRQELMDVQDKRKKADVIVDRLKSECTQVEEEIKGRQNAFDFLTELGDFRDDIRQKYPRDTKEVDFGQVSLPSLICEASGYLSLEGQLRKINDQLQTWLDKHK